MSGFEDDFASTGPVTEAERLRKSDADRAMEELLRRRIDATYSEAEELGKLITDQVFNERGAEPLMTEIVSPLTEDERTVLMIAARGVPMIPIGRWERPVKDLARRGFLRAEDAVNYVITDAGRAASESAERDVDEDFRRLREASPSIGGFSLWRLRDA